MSIRASLTHPHAPHSKTWPQSKEGKTNLVISHKKAEQELARHPHSAYSITRIVPHGQCPSWPACIGCVPCSTCRHTLRRNLDLHTDLCHDGTVLHRSITKATQSTTSLQAMELGVIRCRRSRLWHLRSLIHCGRTTLRRLPAHQSDSTCKGGLDSGVPCGGFQ